MKMRFRNILIKTLLEAFAKTCQAWSVEKVMDGLVGQVENSMLWADCTVWMRLIINARIVGIVEPGTFLWATEQGAKRYGNSGFGF